MGDLTDLPDISGFTREQLTELVARASHVLAETESPASPDVMFLWRAITTQFPAAVKITRPKFIKSIGVKKFTEIAVEFGALLDQAAPGASRTEREAATSIIFEALIRYMMAGTDHPVSAAELVKHLDKAEFACDQHWPHYVRNGMFINVIRFARK